MNYIGPITFAAGFATGLFICALLIQDACADSAMKNPDLRHLITTQGLNCVLYGGEDDGSGRGISCNWDAFNIQKYHDEMQVRPSPIIRRDCTPI